MNYNLTKKELLTLLEEAYEKGCYGYFELQEETANSILEKIEASLMYAEITILKKDLLTLLERAYAKGCGGYLDLKEEISERMLEEYLENSKLKEIKIKGEAGILWPNIMPAQQSFEFVSTPLASSTSMYNYVNTNNTHWFVPSTTTNIGPPLPPNDTIIIRNF